MGSKYGRYATLDLNEASDRVSVGLVHLLFPGQVLPALLAARSLGTQLPDGRKVVLHKYAPMGSALCFPVLALTVWALLKAGLATCDAGGQPTVYVYGDDVIVDTENSEHAMNILEAFGLKVNRDKSCTSGFFRESCGMDAFKGVCVTPVRFRTVWSNHHCPSTYVSWIAYANSMYDRRFFTCYKLIVGWLESIYGYIPAREYIPGIKPSKACTLSAPSLRENTGMKKPRARRWNPHLQKWETLVWDVVPVTCTRKINGWSMLLRFFSEACSSYESGRAHNKADSEVRPHGPINGAEFQSSEYTLRKRNKLRLCWR